MCLITHIAHILCVHATKETHLCTLQNVKSLFSGSGIPLSSTCKHATHEERWNHDFCDACIIIWSANEVPESIAKASTLEYRNNHQYSGPLTPSFGRDRRRMRIIVEDANLTEKQKEGRELAWEYNRRYLEKARVRVEPDESSEFAKQLPRWADAPIEEEYWKVHGLSSELRSPSDSDASTETRWPRPGPGKTETLDQRREVKVSHRAEHQRLESIGPDEYEMVRMRSHSLRTVDRDGFERQMLTWPIRPIALSPSPTFNESSLGRSLTNPRRMAPRANSPDIKPVQRAGSKFAEPI